MCKLLVYGFFEELAITFLAAVWIVCWVIDGLCKWIYIGIKEVIGDIIETYAYITRIVYEALRRVLRRFGR